MAIGLRSTNRPGVTPINTFKSSQNHLHCAWISGCINGSSLKRRLSVTLPRHPELKNTLCVLQPTTINAFRVFLSTMMQGLFKNGVESISVCGTQYRWLTNSSSLKQLHILWPICKKYYSPKTCKLLLSHTVHDHPEARQSHDGTPNDGSPRPCESKTITCYES